MRAVREALLRPACMQARFGRANESLASEWYRRGAAAGRAAGGPAGQCPQVGRHGQPTVRPTRGKPAVLREHPVRGAGLRLAGRLLAALGGSPPETRGLPGAPSPAAPQPARPGKTREGRRDDSGVLPKVAWWNYAASGAAWPFFGTAKPGHHGPLSGPAGQERR